MLSPELVEALRNQWVRLFAGLGVEPDFVQTGFGWLVRLYSAPDRHYHSLEHIAEVLNVVERLSGCAEDPAAVRIAAWFHDAVYDTQRKDNEEASAHLAEQYLLYNFVLEVEDQHAFTRAVTDLIRATDHRSDSLPPDGNTAVILDADLAILGSVESRYRRYAADVRKEYPWVSEVDWKTGRALTLERFLARPRIYHTEVMFTECEAVARRNMTAELAALRG
jgi:predicted metal-dependent HD superfamily phosphohydrolase